MNRDEGQELERVELAVTDVVAREPLARPGIESDEGPEGPAAVEQGSKPRGSRVAFIADTSGASRSTVEVLRTDLAGAEVLSLEIGLDAMGGEGDTAAAILAAGTYRAALVLDGLYGPAVQFTVEDEARSVSLAPPIPFVLIFPVKPTASDEVLVDGVLVSVKRVDLDGFGLEAPRRDFLPATATGLVTVTDLTFGQFEISVSAPDHQTVTEIMELPGRWSAQLDSGHEIQLNGFALHPPFSVAFRLEDVPPELSQADFQIAHTHMGEKVSFDAMGKASLRVPSNCEPLYIKIWFPDGSVSVRYLDGGLPGPGEEHVISVRRDCNLELDVRFDPKIRSQLEGADVAVQVSYLDGNGDAVILGKEVKGDGVVTLEGLPPGEAVASLSVVDEATALSMVWRCEPIALREGSSNHCSLDVAEFPLTVKFVDGDGEPVAGFHAEVYRVPNTTTWMTGGPSDENGILRLPRATEGTYTIRGNSRDWSYSLLDQRIQLSTPNASLEVVLAPIQSVELECEVAGRPRSGASFDIHGPDCEIRFLTRETDEMGKTAPMQLVAGSRARATLRTPGLWMPDRTFELLPGRNLVTAWDLGVIEGNDRRLLAACISALGPSLEEWAASGAIEVQAEGDRGFRVEVPACAYTLEVPGADPRKFSVLRGETVRLP
ncbi:hypothetical protein [Planctomycetes bacterium Poly30]